jgi:hypothetical protein
MSKNKLSAIEWLIKQVNSDCLNSTFIRKELIDLAKAMEKEQIREAYIHAFGERDEIDRNLFFNPPAVEYNEKKFNEYLSETYKIYEQ